MRRKAFFKIVGPARVKRAVFAGKDVYAWFVFHICIMRLFVWKVNGRHDENRVLFLPLIGNNPCLI